MNGTTVTVYDYFEDIQPKLCEYIGIDEKYFRDYHKLVGGGYKDLWHILIDLYDFKNDSYFRMFYIEEPEHLAGNITVNHGDWGLVLLNALIRLQDEYLPQDDRYLLVWMSW